MRILRALALAACAMALSSQAAIINYDDTIANSYYDTESELVWIDFGQTNNLTFDQVLAELGSGGLFYGWRLPTVDEVTQMAFSVVNSGTAAPEFMVENEDFNGEGTIYAYSSNSDTVNGNDSVWTEVFDAIGYNTVYSFGTHFSYRSSGLYETENGMSSFAIWDDVDLMGDGNVRIDEITLNGNTINANFLTTGAADISTLLVRDSVEVSAPATIGLFSLALMALASIRRA